eukprot:403335461
MVFYFESEDGQVIIYMGKDKFENEDLIKYAWPHDIWFHVDNFSSAHVYLRTKTPITSYEEMPVAAVIECAQLTKENSIEGCKKSAVTVIYTWASNLLKNDSMETGAVSFHNRKLVVNMEVEKDKEIIKRINKTKTESYPDFKKELDRHKMQLQKEAMLKKKEEKKQQEMEQKQKIKQEEEKKQAWNEFNDAGSQFVTSNQGPVVEDDFW